MNAINKYFHELVERTGNGWNRFWFTPVDPLGMCVLRICTGLMAVWFLLSFSHDLVNWLGPNGLLPNSLVRQVTDDPNAFWNGRASYLYYVDEPALLWGLHIAGIVVAAMFTIGFVTRITSVATLLIALSYIHRMPMVTGQFEPLLTMLLFYLCWAPCGAELSLDAWLKRRRNRNAPESRVSTTYSLAAGVSQRLVQVHFAAMYLMMALTKLGGSDSWWAGESVWWLIAHSESRLVDLTFLSDWGFLINTWTLGIVAFELLYGVLIWNRLARPLLIAASVVHWLLIGLLTGLLSFAAIMIFANVAFMSPQWLRSIARPADEPEKLPAKRAALGAL